MISASMHSRKIYGLDYVHNENINKAACLCIFDLLCVFIYSLDLLSSGHIYCAT